MTSVKVKFAPSSINGKAGRLFYQIIGGQVVRKIKTEHRIYKREWDITAAQVIVPDVNDPRCEELERVDRNVLIDVNRLRNIIRSLDYRGESYTADSVVALYNDQRGNMTLYKFTQECMVRLIELRQYRTSETYGATLKSFMRFRGGEDTMLIDLTEDLLLDYEAYLKIKGLTMNSVSFYMRILRAIYNRAVERHHIEQLHPFKKVYTGIPKTSKRALALKDIKRIKSLDLRANPKLILARDLFMFSFYTRGMAFVDIAYLRKNSLSNGVLTYVRRKTNQTLHIRWEDCMQEILERHPSTNTEYLLPIINAKGQNARLQYLNMTSKINHQLKEIGNMVGLSTPLTLYVARHSWASIAKRENIPISVISEGMGHTSESTTQIYLASIENSIVDNANNIILNLL